MHLMPYSRQQTRWPDRLRIPSSKHPCQAYATSTPQYTLAWPSPALGEHRWTQQTTLPTLLTCCVLGHDTLALQCPPCAGPVDRVEHLTEVHKVTHECGLGRQGLINPLSHLPLSQLSAGPRCWADNRERYASERVGILLAAPVLVEETRVDHIGVMCKLAKQNYCI